jgi:hypothetical protein
MFNHPASLWFAISHANTKLRECINWLNRQINEISNSDPKITTNELKEALSSCTTQLDEIDKLVRKTISLNLTERQLYIQETVASTEWITGCSRTELSTQLIQAILNAQNKNDHHNLHALLDFHGESTAPNLTHHLSTLWLFQELRSDIINIISATREVCRQCCRLNQHPLQDQSLNRKIFLQTMILAKTTANYYGIAGKIFHIGSSSRDIFGHKEAEGADTAPLYALPTLNNYLQKFEIPSVVYQAEWFWDVIDLCYFPAYTDHIDHAKKSANIIHKIEHDAQKFMSQNDGIHFAVELVYPTRVQHILSRAIVPEQPTAGNPLLDDTVLIPEPENFDEHSYFVAVTLHNPNHLDQEQQFDTKVKRLRNALDTALNQDEESCRRSNERDKFHIQQKIQTAKSSYDQRRSHRTSQSLSKEDHLDARAARRQKNQFENELKVIKDCEKKDLDRYNSVRQLLSDTIKQLYTQFELSHYTNKFLAMAHELMESIRDYSTSKTKTLIYLEKIDHWSTIIELVKNLALTSENGIVENTVRVLNNSLIEQPIQILQSSTSQQQEDDFVVLSKWLSKLQVTLEALKSETEIPTIRTTLEHLQNEYAQMGIPTQTACTHCLWLLSDQLKDDHDHLVELFKTLREHFALQISPPQPKFDTLRKIRSLHKLSVENLRHEINITNRLKGLTESIYDDPFGKSKIPQSDLIQKIIATTDQETQVNQTEKYRIDKLNIENWSASDWREYDTNASDYPTTKYEQIHWQNLLGISKNQSDKTKKIISEQLCKLDYFHRDKREIVRPSERRNIFISSESDKASLTEEHLSEKDGVHIILTDCLPAPNLEQLKGGYETLVEKMNLIANKRPDLINKYPEIYWVVVTASHQLKLAFEAANESENIAECLYRWTKAYLLMIFYETIEKSITPQHNHIDICTVRALRELSQHLARWSMDWKKPSRKGHQALNPKSRNNQVIQALIKHHEYQNDSSYTPQLREYVIDRLSNNRIDVVEVLSKVITLESCPVVHKNMRTIKIKKLLYEGEQNEQLWHNFERLYEKFNEFIDLTTQPNDPHMWQKRVDCIKTFELKERFPSFLVTLENKIDTLEKLNDNNARETNTLRSVYRFFAELFDLEHYIQTIIQLESQLTQHLHNNIHFVKNKPDKITLDQFRNNDDVLELRFSEQLPELPEFNTITTESDIIKLVSKPPQSRLVTSLAQLEDTTHGEIIELSDNLIDIRSKDKRAIMHAIAIKSLVVIFKNTEQNKENIERQIAFADNLTIYAYNIPQLLATRDKIKITLHFSAPLKPHQYSCLRNQESSRVSIRQSFDENKSNVTLPITTIRNIAAEEQHNNIIEILVHQVKTVKFLVDTDYDEESDEFKSAMDFVAKVFESVERRDRNRRFAGQITFCFTKLISGAEYENFLIDKPGAIEITYADSSVKPIINTPESMRIYLQQHEYNSYTSRQIDASLVWLYKCQTLTDILCFILTGNIKPIYKNIDSTSRVQHTGINIPSDHEGAAIDFCNILNTNHYNQESYEPYIIDIENKIGPIRQSNYSAVKIHRNSIKPSQILFLSDGANSISLLPHRFVLDTRPTVDPKRDTALQASDSYTGGKTFKIEKRYDPFTTLQIPAYHISLIKLKDPGNKNKQLTEHLSYDLYITGDENEEHGMTPDTLADLALADIENTYEAWHWKNAEHLEQTTVNKILELRKYSEAFKGTKHTLSEPEYKHKISRFRRILREINTSDQQIQNGEVIYKQAHLLYALPWYRTLTESIQLTAHEQQGDHLATLRAQNMTLSVATHKLAGWGESASTIDALIDLARIAELGGPDSIRAKTLIIHALIFGDITYSPVHIQNDPNETCTFSVQLNKKLYTDESEQYQTRVRSHEKIITEQIESSKIDLDDPLLELTKLYQAGDDYAGILMSQIYLADNLAQYRKDTFEDHQNKGCKILLRLVSNNDNTLAQLLYGICLHHGIGFTRFPSRGIQYIEEAGGNYHANYIQILGKDLLAFECGRFSYTYFTKQSVERLTNTQEIAKRIHDRRLLTDLNIRTYTFFRAASHDEEARQNILQIGLLFTIPGVIDEVKAIRCTLDQDRTHKRIEEQIMKGHEILMRNEDLFYIMLKYEPFKRAFLRKINNDEVPRIFSLKQSGSRKLSQKSSGKTR